MGIAHINRRGETYFLQSGKNKNGKDRYWFGRKMTGAAVAAVPEGFEIYEAPEDAIVFLRRAVASPILATELEQVRAAVRQQVGPENSMVVIAGKKGREIVVYLTPRGDEERVAALHAAFPMLAGQESASRELMRQTRRYEKMMRFTLIEEEPRAYAVERWCFMGSIDDWYFLEGDLPLGKALARYVKHLGKDSFFDLM